MQDPRMCTFTERLWQLKSLRSTHEQIHPLTRTPQGPWWSSSPVHKKLCHICLLTQLHATGATGFVCMGTSGRP